MKILNIAMSAPFTEGYSYQDNLLSEYQHKSGHEVCVLTGLITRDSNGKKVTTDPCDKIMDNGVRLIRIKSGGRFMGILGYYPNISNIIKLLEPDLIFIHGLCSLIPAQAIKYKKINPNAILVADNHQDANNTSLSGLSGILLKLWKNGWKRWIKYFNHIYGITSWRCDFAVEAFGIPEDKVDTLLLGVDTDNLSSDKVGVRQKIRSSLNITPDDFVFVHGGKMNMNKKTLDIIQAFSGIDNPKIKLLLFGSVTEDIKINFKSMLAKDPRIVYIGYVDSKSVHKYFYASDLSLFPGLHSVLWEEAIGCGIPGIFRCFGKYDHTNICGNSISVTAGISVNELRKIMERVLTNQPYYSMLKANADKAATHLSYYDIARKSTQE